MKLGRTQQPEMPFPAHHSVATLPEVRSLGGQPLVPASPKIHVWHLQRKAFV